MFWFLLFLLYSYLLPVYCFDPSKIDYCKLKCKQPDGSEVKNSACFCKKVAPREEETDHMDEFRKLILDAHNAARNKIARGDEKDKGYPSAANMKALNYDLELEHIARCYLISTFVKGHDKCRRASYCKEMGAGQNLWGHGNIEFGFDKGAERSVTNWYSELEYVQPDKREAMIKRFDVSAAKPNKKIGHFTQVIWADATRVGCVRVKQSNKSSLTNPWNYVIGCNYAATDERCPSNIMGMPIYQIGDPCSKCGSLKCNKEAGGPYEALCGEIKPIEKYTPKTEVASEKDVKKNKESGCAKWNAGFSVLVPVVVCFLNLV